MQLTRWALLAPLFASVASCSSADGTFRLDAVRLEDDGSKLRAVLSIHNGRISSAYTYSAPRGIRWDEATRTLTLALVEQDCPPSAGTLCSHYVFPSYARIAPREDVDVAIDLPRTLTRIVASSEGKAAAETADLTTTAHLVVDVAWAEAPVDSSVRGEDPRTAVRAAEREVFRGEWVR